MRGYRSGLLVGLLLAMATGVAADNHEQGEAAMPEMGPPSEMEHVKWMVGDWDAKMQYRMAPDSAWIESDAKSTTMLDVGGAILRTTYTGTMMGMDMVGMGTLFYDREMKHWVSTWIDNMSARQSVYTGGPREDGVIELAGEDMYQGVTYPVKMEVTKTSDDAYTWQMFMTVDGENWFPSMAIEYTRTK